MVLGIEVNIVVPLRAFDHSYETVDVSCDDSRQYLATGNTTDVVDRELTPNDHCDELRVFRSSPDLCHESICASVETASTVTR